METQNVELCLDGFRYFYRVYPNHESNLDPIVIFGGMFDSMDTLTKYAQYINQTAPVILADLPGCGCGTADPLPPHYDFDFSADALLKILTTEQIHRVNMWATSANTYPSFRFAQLYPDKINRIIMSGTEKEIPSYQVEQLKNSITLLEQKQLDAFACLLTDLLTCRDLQKPVKKRRAVEKITRMALCTFSLDQQNKYKQNLLRFLNSPSLDLTSPPDITTLIFTGEHDPFTTPEYCLEVAKLLPEAFYTTVQQADHLFRLEQFRVTMDLVMNFFSGRALDSVPNCTSIEYFNKSMPSALAA